MQENTRKKVQESLILQNTIKISIEGGKEQNDM